MKITISKINNNKIENKEIKFTLNRNKAINPVVKQTINKSIEIDGIAVNFETISVSPLSIEVKGNIPRGSLNIEDSRGKKDVEFDLYINDKKQTIFGSGMSSGLKIEFHREFDGVDDNISNIEIKNIRLVEWEMVDKSIPVDYSVKDMKLQLGRSSVTIKSLSFDGYNTILKMETPKSVEIPVGLVMQNNYLEYIGEEYTEAGDKAVNLFKFKGKGDNMKLLVKGVSYIQKSDESIDIPIE